MKIALLGYGKMGHEVEKTALEQGHTIGAVIDNETDWLLKIQELKACDVAVEFSVPSMAVENIRKCLEAGIPIVAGTTGWYGELQQITDICQSHNGSLFYASNFSIGVNIFFEINRKLASLLESYPSYSPSMVEIHHTQKLDSPSGTAISLANDIIASNQRLKNFTASVPGADEIPVQSIREGNETGTHTISWSSENDRITISHQAMNRQGFALGAVMAAAWLPGRKGVFTMKDLLNLQ